MKIDRHVEFYECYPWRVDYDEVVVSTGLTAGTNVDLETQFLVYSYGLASLEEN